MGYGAIHCGSLHQDGAGAVCTLCLQLQADSESSQEFTLILQIIPQLCF